MSVLPSAYYANHLTMRSLGGQGDARVLGCGFMIKPAGWDNRGTAREAYSAVLCLRGRGRLTIAGHTWAIGPGTLFQRFPGQIHDLNLEASPPWAECYIHLGSTLAGALEVMGVLQRQSPVRTPGIAPGIIRELWRTTDALGAAAASNLPHFLVRLQGLLLSLLGPEPHAAGADLDMERACRLLTDDPIADLSLVARDLGLPYDRFRKRFRELTGLSPGDYRLRRRLEHARTILLSSNRPIQDIARDLGYANPFTFTALFRKHVGCSPMKYRRGER